MYTPPEDAKKILKFIPKEWVIYECCWGDGTMATAFRDEGYTVVGGKDIDFFTHDSPFVNDLSEYDVVITNPPFNNNKDFLRKAIETKKPFAFLCRIEHLGGVSAYDLFKDLTIQIVIPEKRINYITPKVREGIQVAGSPFHSCWITYGLQLEKDILYIK